jgi:uncharacterized coiled-coil protein SlyX
MDQEQATDLLNEVMSFHGSSFNDHQTERLELLADMVVKGISFLDRDTRWLRAIKRKLESSGAKKRESPKKDKGVDKP